MDSIFVKLNKIYDIVSFIHDVNKIPNDIKAKQGRATVDAKSLMGMFSLDLSDKVQIIFDKNLNNRYKELLYKYK